VQGVYADRIVEENSNKSAILNAVIPRVILDDKDHKRYVKFLVLKNLGKITIDSENDFVFETKPGQVINRMTNGVNEIKLRTEQIVLGSIYDKLSQIAMVRTALNPIHSILKNVYKGGFYKDTLKTINPIIKREKYRTYLKFLCNLNILREQTDKYSEGNHFVEIREALNKEDETVILNKVFGLTIRDGKTYLLNNLHFFVLMPFIRVANTYYLSSALVNKLLTMKMSTFYEKYKELYFLNTKQYKFESYVDQLDSAGILEEDDYVIGKKNIFSNVIKHFKATSAP